MGGICLGDISEVLESVNGFLWGIPVLFLILVAGIYISMKGGFPQLRFFREAVRSFLGQVSGGKEPGETPPFRALCTALAATVGTGNIAGVAGAIAIGGPGAVFWMWISGFLGMGIKFAESTMAIRYRIRNDRGELIGGPMYIIREGMGKRWHFLGWVYSFLGLAAAFGVGNATQVNAIISSIHEFATQLGCSPMAGANLLIGLLIAIAVVALVSGGAGKIGQAAEVLIPLVSGVYILLCLVAVGLHWDRMPSVFSGIISGAFSPSAFTGGAVGSAWTALRIGVSRGVFTNEAGMGTASIAHAAASVDHPVEQGLMGIMEVFIDTIVICTMTALVILCSGISIPYGQDMGIQITANAFSEIYGSWVHMPLAFTLCCLAFATIIGWGLYGTRCAQFLFGEAAWRKFVFLQAGSVVLGAVLSTGTVWSLSEIANGLMAIPNLIILLYFSPELVKLTVNYKNNGTIVATGGTYEDFHQCEPLRTLSNANVPPIGGKSKGGW